MRKPKQPRPAPAITVVDKLEDITGGKILAVTEPRMARHASSFATCAT